jgi:hypothetical protein
MDESFRVGEYAIINRDWRSIHDGDDSEELYNVREDPNEWNNLASEAQYAAESRGLQLSVLRIEKMKLGRNMGVIWGWKLENGQCVGSPIVGTDKGNA